MSQLSTANHHVESVSMDQHVELQSIVHPDAGTTFESSVSVRVCHLCSLVLPVPTGSSSSVHALAHFPAPIRSADALRRLHVQLANLIGLPSATSASASSIKSGFSTATRARGHADDQPEYEQWGVFQQTCLCESVESPSHIWVISVYFVDSDPSGCCPVCWKLGVRGIEKQIFL